MGLPDHSGKVAAAGVLLGMVGTVFASREPAATVRQVIAGQCPPAVSVRGWVQVRQPNRFILHDETGAFRLETCPIWYRSLPLRPGERIAVQGELAPRVRWRQGEPVFLVYRFRRENGAEITLRYDRGPPPWQREIWRAEGE